MLFSMGAGGVLRGRPRRLGGGASAGGARISVLALFVMVVSAGAASASAFLRRGARLRTGFSVSAVVLSDAVTSAGASLAKASSEADGASGAGVATVSCATLRPLLRGVVVRGLEGPEVVFAFK
ncbi:hypothetical protein AA106556_1684 [Neokomagataea tanensis NBRC 106556]|uniref:Uncharacterized protein n=1 Tax=Neokomagataea tanensis NBRC 106556 TaxID=1223519 RepID=A0ABQ0QKJ3_9PROT|nr:hypothetical protein AA106556_1684 [Neokomagataea tanensis NBRC 106556]